MFPSTTKEGTPIGGWRKLPSPNPSQDPYTPFRPVWISRIWALQVNQSWEYKKVLGPFQCMQRNASFFLPLDEEVQSRTWVLHLTWSELASNLPPPKKPTNFQKSIVIKIKHKKSLCGFKSTLYEGRFVGLHCNERFFSEPLLEKKIERNSIDNITFSIQFHKTGTKSP